MRVLHVLASRGAGGAEVLVRDLAVELNRKDVEVAIAFVSRVADLGGSPEFEARYQETLDAASVRTFDMGHECRRNPILGALRLRAILKQFRPDILHIHLQFGLLFRLLLWPRRIPTVYTHHIDRFRRGRAVFRALSLTVDRFVAISRQTERLLRDAVGDRVTYIVNAVRFTPGRSPSPKRAGDSCFQVLSIGGLYPQKDYPTLVRTAARVLEIRPAVSGRIRFLLAGEGPERARLERQIADAGLESTVVLLGTRTDVHELMERSDLLLMTSAYEGLPIALIEALHAGLPIVATEVGGVGEVVDHGNNGLLARSGDENGLAENVLKLIDDPDLRTGFGKASLVKARRYSIEANAEQHLALYRQVRQDAGI